ncbi:MAG TPA: hypothetical protein VIN69_10905 [Candidatus Limnocylindria bacterium]
MRTPTHASLRRLAAGGLTSIAIVLSACGGAATASPSPSATAAAKATLAPVTAATTAPTAAAAAVVNVEAYQAGDSFLLKADQIAVPAGKVTFNFKNTGTMTHEVLVYPVQDVTKLLALKRSGNDAEEKDYIKGLAVGLMDIESGKTATADATLAPGFYELACWAVGKNPDGSTYEHFDKGQTLTLAVTGPGGPSAAITTAANAIKVTMQDGTDGSWVLIPDRLVATAGDVTFTLTNGMKIDHDFAVYPLGDVSGPIAAGLKSGQDIDLTAPAVELFQDLAPGKTDSKSVKLAAGTYVMACFMVSKNADGTTFVHRDMGQRITFIVK